MEATGRWFSANPDRAWVEKFFLVYTPIWIGMLVLFEAFFDQGDLGDVPLLSLGAVVAAPLLIVPAIIARRRSNEPLHQQFWLKAFVYVAIVNFFGNYFGSEYFFDVLGMIYNYPKLHIHLDAALVGSGEQRVPVLMYLLTQATYTTYHTTAAVVMRRILTTQIPMKRLVLCVLTLILSYAWAWTETMSFANAEIESNFRYVDRDTMLRYGSIVFGLAFVFSFPLFYKLDDDPDRPWTPWNVIGAAMTAALMGIFLQDIATHLIGTLAPR